MLNRTSLMLSAHSHRLNLGTRSLAIMASAFNVVAPRPSLDDRHTRMDFPRKEFGIITGKHPQGYLGGIPISGSPPAGSIHTPWVSWSCPRVEIVADQPTPASEVVTHDVRRRRRPVRTARADAMTPPSPTRCATRAAGG